MSKETVGRDFLRIRSKKTEPVLEPLRILVTEPGARPYTLLIFLGGMTAKAYDRGD